MLMILGGSERKDVPLTSVNVISTQLKWGVHLIPAIQIYSVQFVEWASFAVSVYRKQD